MPTNDKPIESTPPASPYDFFTEGLIKSVEKDLHKQVGRRSEMIIKQHSAASSIFNHTDQGLVCKSCGVLQANPDAESCVACGMAYSITLYVGVGE